MSYSSGSEGSYYDDDEEGGGAHGAAAFDAYDASRRDAGDDWSGSSGSDDGAADPMAMNPDEYLRAVGVIAMIDAAYLAVEDAQPYACDLVELLARAFEVWRPPRAGDLMGDDELMPGAAEELSALLLESPTTPSDVLVGLDPEALFLQGVEAALVEGVRQLVAERPFADEVPHFIANQVRIGAARLPLPPDPRDEEDDEAAADADEPLIARAGGGEPEPEPEHSGDESPDDPLAALRERRPQVRVEGGQVWVALGGGAADSDDEEDEALRDLQGRSLGGDDGGVPSLGMKLRGGGLVLGGKGQGARALRMGAVGGKLAPLSPSR